MNFGNGALVGFPLPETSPCGKSRIRICWSGAKGPREIAVAEAALDDVFIDDISFPAADRYLLGATLFLPRRAKRHAVLINSATAVPRKIYRGFAGYLAGRGCAVLTYDYRGIGDSRQKSPVGYNQPKSLAGLKASMSEWAALDVTAAVGWMRERYLFDDARLSSLKNFPQFNGAMRALCFSDDPWATRPAVELLCAGFVSAKPEILTITPADVGATKIGHFGFFRPEHRDTLWRGAAEWIEASE